MHPRRPGRRATDEPSLVLPAENRPADAGEPVLQALDRARAAEGLGIQAVRQAGAGLLRRAVRLAAERRGFAEERRQDLTVGRNVLQAPVLDRPPGDEGADLLERQAGVGVEGEGGGDQVGEEVPRRPRRRPDRAASRP